MTTEHNHSHDHVHDDAPDAAMTAPPLYWSTLSELDQDGEYRARVGEEFYPEAKPERFFEVAGDEEKIVSPFSRRTFLKFSAFSALVAAVSGCERPVQKVLPYVAKPEEINYGVANFYASTCRECAAACGLLVKTREGRPIKLEGNPDHPMNRGALCARGQAGVLNLYNPDRLKSPVRAQRKGNLVEASTNGFAKMAEFDKEIGAAIAGTRGRVVLLTPTISGPSNERLIKDFLSVTTNAQHVMYDALETGEERELYNTVFSKPVTPRYRFQNANVVLNLGGDPLGQHVSQSEIQRDWAAKRAPNAEGGMSRVYTFEPVPTLSGINSDYRHAVRPADLFRAGLVIAALVYKQLKGSSAANAVVKNADTEKLLGGVDAESLAQETGIALKEYERVAKSLVDAPTRSIVYTKGAAADTADAKNLHLLGILMNAMLGNYQNTIDTIVTTSKQSLGSTAAMQQLVADMNSGAVEVLIFHGVNPAYTLPKSVGFAQALAKVKLVVSLNLMMDESASLADIAIPAVHGLESWGDAEAQTGVYSMQQPAINPIFGETSADPTFATRAWQESLMAFIVAAGSPVFRRVPSKADIQRLMEDQGTTDTLKLDPKSLQPYNITWYDYIRETWRDQIYARTPFASPTFEAFWTTLVQTGVLDTVGAQSRNGALAAPNINPALMGSIGAPAKSEGLTFVAQPSVVHGDGSSMINPFLLELPDSVSKVCWDNYASIAPSLAKQLDVEDGEYVNVTVGETTVKVPAYIQPGAHKDVVSVGLGWGRTGIHGALGEGIGVDVFPLVEATRTSLVTSGRQVKIEKAGGRTKLANIQGHNYLYVPSYAGMMVNKRVGEVPEGATRNEQGTAVWERPIIAETTLNEWKENPSKAYPNHVEQNGLPKSVWLHKHKYEGHHWGMIVDLNACNGCNACMVACSVENNVPVVGKAEVLKGREMFWIRIDRYYRGDRENPDFVQMPLMCNHCGNAPCETVCPVMATMHNDEGLNVMTYNRCVGTRYCANNCPYKVRRFNFFQYSDFRMGRQDGRERVSPLELVLNPDVSTRTRGVMEKCTFCVHRIRAAKDKAREEGSPLKDGELQTACQQTCPAKAIHFGDRNDPNSVVAKLWQDPRNYGLLEDLNTDPSVRYFALVRNRDEASPYRSMYQAHHVDHHGGGHGEAAGHGESASHEKKEGGAPAEHAPANSRGH